MFIPSPFVFHLVSKIHDSMLYLSKFDKHSVLAKQKIKRSLLSDVLIPSTVELHQVNSMRPSDAYMCHKTKPPLGQIMACRLIGAKPLPEVLNQCWFIVNWTLRNKHQWNSNRKTKFFIHKNSFGTVCGNGCHFLVSASMFNHSHGKMGTSLVSSMREDLKTCHITVEIKGTEYPLKTIQYMIKFSICETIFINISQ